jgi:hypothetical protein
MPIQKVHNLLKHRVRTHSEGDTLTLRDGVM